MMRNEHDIKVNTQFIDSNNNMMSYLTLKCLPKILNYG